MAEKKVRGVLGWAPTIALVGGVALIFCGIMVWKGSETQEGKFLAGVFVIFGVLALIKSHLYSRINRDLSDDPVKRGRGVRGP